MLLFLPERMRIQFDIFTTNYNYSQKYLDDSQVFEVYFSYAYKIILLDFEFLYEYLL